MAKVMKNNNIVEQVLPSEGECLVMEIADETISKSNKNKVYFEELHLLAVKEFLFMQDNFDFDLSYELPDSQKNKNRRELFPLNYLNINKNYLSIIASPENNPEKIFIPRKIFDSKLSADYFIPVSLDEDNRKASILGFISYQDIINNFWTDSPDFYYVYSDKLRPPGELIEILSKENEKQEKIIYDVTFSEEGINSTLEIFQESLVNKLIPNDFFESPDFFPESFYFGLLYSEELSGKYLEVQKMYYELSETKDSKPLAEIIDFKERIQKKLASVLLFNSSKYNQRIRTAAASSKGKAEVIVYEFDGENVFKTELKPEVSPDPFDHTLLIEGLGKYKGKNWLLFIEIPGTLEKIGFSDEAKGNIFKNWNEEFFEKTIKDISEQCFTFSSGYAPGHPVKDDYINLKLGDLELPNEINIYLAFLTEQE